MTSTTQTALPNDAYDSIFSAFERLWKVIIERDETIKSRDNAIAARDDRRAVADSDNARQNLGAHHW